jgi:hypothetical protein
MWDLSKTLYPSESHIHGWRGAIRRTAGHLRLTAFQPGLEDGLALVWLLQRAHSMVHVVTAMTFRGVPAAPVL